MIKFGSCNCGKWGMAPKEFRENKHFLVCECGKDMYLTMFMTPESLGLRKENKITPRLRLHGGE